MPKPALEFFPVASVEWTAVSPGVWERVLARDDDGVGLTRILRWDPGLDTSPHGAAVHDYVEEVLILSGAMHDLTLDATFTAGDYACRPRAWCTAPGRAPRAARCSRCGTGQGQAAQVRIA
jgi:hypothetical protein